MIRADEKLVTALARLHNNADFDAFRSWLNASFLDHLSGIVDLPAGDATEKGKGYCGALKDIMDKVNDPRKLAEKFSKQGGLHGR